MHIHIIYKRIYIHVCTYVVGVYVCIYMIIANLLALTMYNALATLTMTTKAFTASLLYQRWTMFTAILWRSYYFTLTKYNSRTATLIAFAPWGPIAHLTIDHCKRVARIIAKCWMKL